MAPRRLCSLRSLRLAVLTGLVLPGAVALTYAATSPLRQASACSLPYGIEGWRTLSFLHHEGEVATDGFIVIAGVTDLVESELASSVRVVVTDDSGAEVPGTVTVINAVPDLSGRRFLGWSAAEPLALDAKLTAKLETERISVGTDPTLLGEELALVVVAEPTELSAGMPSFGDWGTFSHGVGEPVSCMPGASGCGPGLPPYDLPSTGHGYAMVPAGEERVRSAMTHWQLPEIRGNVAWEAAVVLVGDATGALVPGERPQVFSAADAKAKPPTTGVMVFPAEPEDYCIALRVRDLRTGDEAQSEPVCGEPGASKFTTADTWIRNCAMPPNDALAQTWCEMHPGSGLEQCRPGYTGSGGGGSGGSSGSGNGGDEPNPRPNDGQDSPATGTTPDSSGGCSLGGPQRGASGRALIGLLGLTLLVRRRRAA